MLLLLKSAWTSRFLHFANRAASIDFTVAKSTYLLEKKRFPTISREQVQKTQTHAKNKDLKKHQTKLISHAFFKSSSSCFSRAVLAAYSRRNSYSCTHIIPSWHRWYVHHAGNLRIQHVTNNKRKHANLEPSLTATQHSSSSLFHLPQSDQTFYLLSMSIAVFYLHCARKRYKIISQGLW